MNNVIADNQVLESGSGGGLYIAHSRPRLFKTTLARNLGGDGSGIYITIDSACFSFGRGCEYWTRFSTVEMTNTILVSHTVGISISYGPPAGMSPTEVHTVTINGILWDTGTPITVSQSITAHVESRNSFTGAPAFAPDGFHLTVNSAARDEGVETDVSFDIDGESRPQGAQADLGADELPVPILTISKVGPTTALAGAPITFTLVVTNSGPVSATGVVVTDALPSGAYYVSGGTLMPGDIVSWTVGTLLENDDAQVQFVVTATQTITNSDYQVSYSEGVTVTGGAPVTVIIGTPVLAISKAGPPEVRPGEFVTYTLTITNSGPVSATGVVVTDALPSGAYYVSGGTLMPGSVVSWTVGTLLDNDNARVQFVVTATQTITNSAYRVSCAEGVSAAGTEAVVTRVEHKIYLPILVKGGIYPEAYLPIFAQGMYVPVQVESIGYIEMPMLPRHVAVVNGRAYVALCEEVEETPHPYDWRGGLQLIDVSTPSLPSNLGSYVGGYCVWETAVDGEYAYVADAKSRGGSLMIVDISDPASPSLVSYWSLVPGAGVSSVAVAEERAYVAPAFWRGGLIALDISSPAHPTPVGEHPVSAFVEDILVDGNRVYLADSDGLDILDRRTLNRIGYYPAPDRPGSVAVQGKYAYVGSSYGDLYIVDISNPAKPAEIGSYDVPGGHGDIQIAIVGKHLYFPAGGNGVRILDVSNPQVPTEMAFYDTPAYAYSVTAEGEYVYVAHSDGVSIFPLYESTDHSR